MTCHAHRGRRLPRLCHLAAGSLVQPPRRLRGPLLPLSRRCRRGFRGRRSGHLFALAPKWGRLPGSLGPKWPLQLHSRLPTLSAALPAIHGECWHAGPIKAGCNREHQGRFGLVQRRGAPQPRGEHLRRKARHRGTSAARRGTEVRCTSSQRARHNQVGYLGELIEPEARSSLAPLPVSENGRNTPFPQADAVTQGPYRFRAERAAGVLHTVESSLAKRSRLTLSGPPLCDTKCPDVVHSLAPPAPSHLRCDSGGFKA